MPLRSPPASRSGKRPRRDASGKDGLTLSGDIGANPSAEEAEEGTEGNAVQVIDVVDSFRLNFLGDEASGNRLFTTKKDYASQLKSKTASEPLAPTGR